MSSQTPQATDRVVRLTVTPDEFKRLKMIALQRDLELRVLITEAVRTSPITQEAFNQ